MRKPPSRPGTPPPPPSSPLRPRLRVPQIRTRLGVRLEQHPLHRPQRRLWQNEPLGPVVLPEPRARQLGHARVAAEAEFSQRARVVIALVAVAGTVQDETGADAAVNVFVGVAQGFASRLAGAWIGAVLCCFIREPGGVSGGERIVRGDSRSRMVFGLWYHQVRMLAARLDISSRRLSCLHGCLTGRDAIVDFPLQRHERPCLQTASR